MENKQQLYKVEVHVEWKAKDKNGKKFTAEQVQYFEVTRPSREDIAQLREHVQQSLRIDDKDFTMTVKPIFMLVPCDEYDNFVTDLPAPTPAPQGGKVDQLIKETENA